SSPASAPSARASWRFGPSADSASKSPAFRIHVALRQRGAGDIRMRGASGAAIERGGTGIMPEPRTATGSLYACAAVLLGLVVAGCTTADPGSLAKAEIDPASGSEANIDSLTAVIQRAPSDANGYNVRGTAYGKAGKLRDAL